MLRRFALTALAALSIASLASALRADGVSSDPGHLRQTVLVILRFPPEGRPGELRPADEAHVNSQLRAASDFIWLSSNQLLKVDFHPVKVLKTLSAEDYQSYSSGAAARYTAGLHDALQRRHINPEDYAGLVMIYRPTNAPSGLFNNTWIWYNENIASVKRNPGFSSVVFRTDDLLGEVVVHEYLHQIDHRFERETGNPDPAQHGFLNPDDMNRPAGQRLAQLLGTTFAYPKEYYQAMLKLYVGADNQLHPVNYRWLEGYRGAFYGDEPRRHYDFGQSDDQLLYAGGDNTAFVRSGNPDSFWFRAMPGHTAAFRTQTAYGRYLLKSAAFNYEIAPTDYSFQVWLVYYDNHGQTVRQRIDDGVFTLGRQKFQTNRKRLTINLEVEDFQIVFQKGNQIVGLGANDDWALLGDITLDLALAP